MAAPRPDWSSLQPELVRRIADCLLDTNDLDSYIDFRAVCPNWRSTTDDPKNSSQLRFRPCRWIIIDEVFQSDSRLLVNIVSGRVVRKDLPLLSRYDVVATTHGGFFVLADKKTHAAVVLNPFTGHTIRFKAPLPSSVDISDAALSGLVTGRPEPSVVSESELHSSPTLILLSDEFCRQYMAVCESDRFTVDEEALKSFILFRLAVAGGICAADGWQRIVPAFPISWVNKFLRLIKMFGIDPFKMFSDEHVTGFADIPGTGEANHLFQVESAGELLAVVKLQQHLKVFRLDRVTDGDELEPVKSIGDRAIFVGYRRCFSVSADKFPSVVANCIYYVKSTDSSLDIYQYDLGTEKGERVCEAIDSLNSFTLSFANPPFTIVQLLSGYTINGLEFQLAMQRFEVHLPNELFQLPEDYSDLDDSDLDLDYSEFYD
ncbi:hypothetical protein ZWY2020_026528 [Hordeum vulgare]|nr:hypothetical protein ZWY2020_026528 [Hordeum vulgare]